MLSNIEEGLKKLGLKYNPFKDISSEDPNFRKQFVNRTKELYKMDLALEFYKGGGSKNLVLIGQPRMGKTTLFYFIMSEIEDKFKCVYFEFPPTIKEFLAKIVEELGEEQGESTGKNLRDYGNRFMEISHEHSRQLVIIIDNFEEMLQIDKEELNEFVRIFRRSKALFIVACTPKEWEELVNYESLLKNIFSEEILLEPFDVEYCRKLLSSRISVSREDGDYSDIYPFDDSSVRLIGIYSFFIPGRIIDLSNKVLFEAVSEEVDQINADFVKKTVFESPTIRKHLEGLSKKEIEALEVMIEFGEPVSFEALSEKMNVSRVAVAGYVQKLIERGLVKHMESPGKRKLFEVNERFKSLLV